MPIFDDERVYVTYGSFLKTWITFGSAIWIFLIGSALPTVGNTQLALIGYTCGLILGFTPVLLGAALPSFKYGLDSIDFSKSALGVRGAFLPLGALLVVSVGW